MKRMNGGGFHMFFRRRRHSLLLRILLVVLGMKWLSKRNHACNHDGDHAATRARARAFRSKLREAAAVWDDPSFDSVQDGDEQTQ